MRKKQLTVCCLSLLLFAASSFALDSGGRKAGELTGGFAADKYKTKSDIDMKVKMPMTDSTTELTTLDGSKKKSAPSFCGQGDVKDQALAIEVTLEPTTITVGTDTNADGFIDSVQTQAIDNICTEGVQVGTTYLAWQVSNSGVVTATSSGKLGGCVTPASAPPSYAGGKIAELYAAKTGRTIMGSRQKSTKISYYSGQVKDCNNQPQDLSVTKYYDNPYSMEGDGVNQASACAGSDSASCVAYQGMQGANNNVSSGSGDVTCTISRKTPTTKGPQNGKICEANRVFSANGYSESNKWCQLQTRWDYTSQLQMRCDPYGTAVKVEGWASWEGAPCGTRANFPPSNQISREVGYSDVGDTIIGKFSVNYRMDGPNTAPNDLSADARCYSDLNPLNVHMNTVCAADKSSCDYGFTIDNAPSCASFVVRVSPPVGDEINDGCSLYSGSESTYNCKLRDERWQDANGTWTPIVSGGNPTHNEPPDTCKTFSGVGTVCKPWWVKERTYNCQNKKNSDPDITRINTVTGSTALTGTTVTYNSDECSEPGAECKADTWDQTAVAGDSCEMSCLVKRVAGAAQKGNSQYDYYAQPCDKKTIGGTTTYSCPLQSGDTKVKDCDCIDTSGQAIGVLGAVYEAARDRQCKN